MHGRALLHRFGRPYGLGPGRPEVRCGKDRGPNEDHGEGGECPRLQPAPGLQPQRQALPDSGHDPAPPPPARGRAARFRPPESRAGRPGRSRSRKRRPNLRRSGNPDMTGERRAGRGVGRRVVEEAHGGSRRPGRRHSGARNMGRRGGRHTTWPTTTPRGFTLFVRLAQQRVRAAPRLGDDRRTGPTCEPTPDVTAARTHTRRAAGTVPRPSARARGSGTAGSRSTGSGTVGSKAVGRHAGRVTGRADGCVSVCSTGCVRCLR